MLTKIGSATTAITSTIPSGKYAIDARPPLATITSPAILSFTTTRCTTTLLTTKILSKNTSTTPRIPFSQMLSPGKAMLTKVKMGELTQTNKPTEMLRWKKELTRKVST
jgi:hypothetical protein